MHSRKHTDQGFDDFYRERKRVRAKLGPKASVLGYENQALRELEQVEAREVRDQQLTREVHDFFAAATKQAAAIVEKVSHDAQEEAGERLQTEVESFLMDTLSRMNSFLSTMMSNGDNQNVAETQVEPDVKHLVGRELDEFRYESNSELREAHIGQDPFATPLEDVQAEFRAVVAEMTDEEPESASIEDHLVAETCAQDDDPACADASAEQHEDVAYASESAAPEHEPTVDEQAAEIAAEAEQPTDPEAELETFKTTLKALVRQGVMNREEARAAWLARLEKLGR